MKQLFCALALGIASLASAQDKVVLLPTPLEMPRRIGPLQLAGEPHRYQPASLGVSYQYQGSGLSLTVYVFDMGVADIPDGGDTVPTCYVFEMAKQDIHSAGYAGIRLVSEQLVRLSPPGDLPLAREAVLEYEREGRPTISYIWITAVAKHFVKMRFSLSQNLRDEVPEARRAVLDALGVAVKPHLLPVAAEADQKTGSSITLNFGGNDDVAESFLYQLLLSAAAEKMPEQVPVCGGPIEPSFEAEVAVFQSMAAKEADDSQSKFSKQLSDAEAAGFLEELVWQDMHREAWGDTDPPGLELAGYKAWKKKNLKRFRRPNLGQVVIKNPRAMPIEAAGVP